MVQLRQDNLAASHFSIVGFQTQLKWGEQKRVFRMIPGLENAEFVRFGMIHRNTYVNAPVLPRAHASRRAAARASSSPARCRASRATSSRRPRGCSPASAPPSEPRGEAPPAFPEDTALGALGRYIARSDPKHYQPTNIAFGLLPELPADGPRQGEEAPRPLGARPGSLERLSLSTSAGGVPRARR